MSRSAVPALGVALALVAVVAFGGCAAATKSEPAPHPSLSAAGEPDESPDKPDKPNLPDTPDNSAGESGQVEVRAGGGGMPSLNTDSDSAGAGNAVETCAAQATEAKVVPLDMYLMVDSSSSMLSELSTNSTKWSAVRSALRTFLRKKTSAGLGVGLQYFPIIRANVPDSCQKDADCGDGTTCTVPGICWADGQFTDIGLCLSNDDCIFGPCIQGGNCVNDTDYACPKQGASCDPPGPTVLGLCGPSTVAGFCASTSVCDASAYATPAEPIATLPDATDALLASLDEHAPDATKGLTPTGPALRGALQQASKWSKAHPSHRTVVVLATDGLPTDCSPTNIDEIGDLAADALSTTGVKTVVIGMLTQSDISNGAQKQLDTIANAGGTDKAIVVDTSQDVANQFVTALDAIRTDPLVCQYTIPVPASGKNLDYSKVNVNFKHGKESTPMFYVGTVDDCDPDTGGWYYDTDPKQTAPTTIYACPSSCTAFQAASNASVEIALGCETIVK